DCEHCPRKPKKGSADILDVSDPAMLYQIGQAENANCHCPLFSSFYFLTSYSHMITSWQVATAAEAFAAAQFARCGWDVSVQYGANQPEYDLVAVDGERLLKISVKGSQD